MNIKHLTIAFILLFLIASPIKAQWVVNGNDLYYDAGKIGVGTPFPDRQLTVYGNVRLGSEGVGGLVSRNGILIQTTGNRTELKWQHFGSSNNPYLAVDPSLNAARLIFGTNGADRMVIHSNGNVGIGTGDNTPGSRLTVNGSIHAKEVKVNLNVPGPDYVFDKNYALTSLPDTEKYIKKHKHLPGIPSAKEMEANGINLSEMNMKLLEKVEELTLHLIKINTKVERLENENEQLKKQLYR